MLSHDTDVLPQLEADPVSRHILTQEIKSQVDLSARVDANPTSRRDGQLRFQYNPAPNWGPGSRAVVNVGDGKMSKSKRNQNKHIKHREKRQHSQTSVDDARKKQNTDDNVVE